MSSQNAHRDSHAQALLFTGLTGFCCLYFTYIFSGTLHHEPFGYRGQDVSGLLLLFWSGLALTRLLWMLEINLFFSRIHKHRDQDKNLPQRLLQDLNYRLVMQNASEAWKAFNTVSLTWFLLGVLYLIWAIMVSVSPLEHEALQALQKDLFAYLQAQTDDVHNTLPMNYSYLWSLVSRVALIGILFWLAQSFSHNYKNIEMVLWVFLCLFLMSFLHYLGLQNFQFEFPNSNAYSDNLWHGYGWVHTPILGMMEILPVEHLSPFQLRLLSLGIPSIAILYSLGFLTFSMMVRGIFFSSHNRIYAAIGCGIVVLMGFCDLFLVYHADIYGLWFSGWTCLAILWVKAGSRGEKRYRLYSR